LTAIMLLPLVQLFFGPFLVHSRHRHCLVNKNGIFCGDYNAHMHRIGLTVWWAIFLFLVYIFILGKKEKNNQTDFPY